MTILSDHDLKATMATGIQLVSPEPERRQIQPASIDLRLGDYLRFFPKGLSAAVDVRVPAPYLTDVKTLKDDVPYWLHPGEFVLGVTYETINVPDYLVAELKGKSSLGRLGLMIHATAGYIDPGWKGPLTMELSNVGPVSISLYKDMWIAQIVFQQLYSPADRPYGSEGLGSKYADADKVPQASRAHLEGPVV